MKIHQTAIVDGKAQVGAEVEIGPFSIIGAEAIIGEGCIIQSHVVIAGSVKVGPGNFIGHGTVIGTTPQDLSFRPETKSGVEIGTANVIREYCTIHRASTEGRATVMGDRNFLMAGVHLGHDCKIGNEVVAANNSLVGGHVRIDDGAFLGGGSVFHQSIRIGRLVMVQGRTVKSVPPFVSAVTNQAFGINVLGMRRANLTATEREEIKRAFKLLYRSGLNTAQALQEAGKSEFGPLGLEFFDFVANTGKRGFVSYRSGPGSDE